MTPKRFSRQDWTDLGLKILGEQGPAGVTVAAICEAAQRTRGSLYHHFKDIEALLVGILNRWQELHTDQLIDMVDAARAARGGGPVRLNTLAINLDFSIERNVRRLIASRPQLRHHVAEVDTLRIAYLSKLMREDVGLNPIQADVFAQVEYAAWLGFQHLEPEPDKARLSLLYDAFSSMILQAVESA